ncbi:MAG: hypothetical protein RBS72_19480 [Sedimentisphaerales bacterium]|jgi:hypothetical protein|nr:hypothetical protein [Sedimentisphaerales bacterium]HNY80083.1 hypothetical protein [Sedimentisphaerales bacterium]HOC64966.1 hypothetical protein [Sedimentisphaerales bacterium]HOH65866.1 hypothetical protein [Sedimentisphaerales bacterium]HQA90906.1 hypothetical protein [Sedimentisphaerales bacterium]
MRRAWIGLALLSTSWLFALGYYHDPDWAIWALLVLAGVGLLVGIDLRAPAHIESVVAAALLAPVVLLAPWPWRAPVLLLVAGLLLCVAPIPRRWPRRLGLATLTAGMILTFQAAGMLAYESFTARSHELPWQLARMLHVAAQTLGIPAALDGTTLALYSIRHTHRLGATWGLLLDPVTFSFLVGGVALLCLRTPATSFAGILRHGISQLLGLILCIALWLPARAAILVAVHMHRALRTSYEAPLALMGPFWNPWVLLLLLAGPVFLAWRFVRMPIATTTRPIAAAGRSRRIVCVVMAFAAALLVTVGLLWAPSGPRKQGRIWVDEHRSTWERTDRPYDPNWYGQDSGYNYACIYDYGSRYYDMGRLNAPIDANTLDGCDVLVVKVPTARYTPEEIAHIERFVEAGGGLLLVGEHTNVFNSGTYLNDVATRFGCRFRYDCLFDIDTPFEQLYRPPLVPHPIVQHMPPMDFAVSCSIEPQSSAGRAVIRATGLRSLPADYHASNYYPQVEDRADARYGAFLQLWTADHGSGRVAAFGDSTIFSNFSTFEPGKAELMLGMLEWLNHKAPSRDARPVLIVLGVLLGAGVLVVGRTWPGAGFVLVSGVLLGVTTAGLAVRAMHQAAMPLPKAGRPFTHVVIDRTVCGTPLSRSGFIAGQADGFGIFERWILRLGYFTSRRSGPDAFSGDVLVFLYPGKEVSADFRRQLADYVNGGGRVLVIDAPASVRSTANALLHPFGMRMINTPLLAGPLETPAGWPVNVTARNAGRIEGGTPLIRIAGQPVAATAEFGKGTITAIGFGAQFADLNMGVTADTIPDVAMRNLYELQFQLLRSIVSDAGPVAADPNTAGR